MRILNEIMEARGERLCFTRDGDALTNKAGGRWLDCVVSSPGRVSLLGVRLRSVRGFDQENGGQLLQQIGQFSGSTSLGWTHPGSRVNAREAGDPKSNRGPGGWAGLQEKCELRFLRVPCSRREVMRQYAWATDMLQRGASLLEVGQVLRHRDLATTECATARMTPPTRRARRKSPLGLSRDNVVLRCGDQPLVGRGPR
jgi:hypothetical protein